tara:strand:- start:167 stop:439 length:273 start_codon:yes stop_codon:yes gene_type:complete
MDVEDVLLLSLGITGEFWKNEKPDLLLHVDGGTRIAGSAGVCKLLPLLFKLVIVLDIIGWDIILMEERVLFPRCILSIFMVAVLNFFVLL